MYNGKSNIAAITNSRLAQFWETIALYLTTHIKTVCDKETFTSLNFCDISVTIKNINFFQIDLRFYSMPLFL